MVFKPGSLFLILFLSGFTVCQSQETGKMMIVIIDGARYSETLGDPTHTYTPEMWSLTAQGTMVDHFTNDGITKTYRAIPALWAGAWTEVIDTIYQGSETQYAKLPSIFEYYRKQKNRPADDCFYILKYISSLWLPSFDPDYGPGFWPEFHSVGSTDEDVVTETQWVMDNYHPHFMWVYLADVDHAGHSGNWTTYTAAIRTADSIVGVLWQKLQSDPFYKDSTTLIVTNDHGRHDDQHGGFKGHGDGCEGCRHIQFLAVGPGIKKDFVSTTDRSIPDMAVTASSLLGIDPEKASGNIMHEIIDVTGIDEGVEPKFVLHGSYPNPFCSSTSINYYLREASQVYLQVFNLKGESITTLLNERQIPGEKSIKWDATNKRGQKVSPGVYSFTLHIGQQKTSGKLVFAGE
ncbi:MAG: alkaline phosphatase family protein [Bacteroidales bacterium]|nr:alkaline phosphatase family protein [Bacteroidales bacterium]